MPRFVRDKLGYKNCNRVVLFLGFLRNLSNISNCRCDNIAIAGINVFKSNIWEVIGKFMEDFLVFFLSLLSGNVHGQNFISNALSVVNSTNADSGNISH